MVPLAGVEPAHTKLSTWPLYQIAYKGKNKHGAQVSVPIGLPGLSRIREYKLFGGQPILRYCGPEIAMSPSDSILPSIHAVVP
jgi:hypothetical protein